MQWQLQGVAIVTRDSYRYRYITRQTCEMCKTQTDRKRERDRQWEARQQQQPRRSLASRSPHWQVVDTFVSHACTWIASLCVAIFKHFTSKFIKQTKCQNAASMCWVAHSDVLRLRVRLRELIRFSTHFGRFELVNAYVTPHLMMMQQQQQ